MKNIAKHIITGIYEVFSIEARIHRTISTRSFTAYATAYTGLRISAKYDAEKLVAIDNVLEKRFGVLNALRIK